VVAWYHAAVTLIALTGPNGEELDINPVEVVSLRVEFDDSGSFHSLVQCVVKFVDGSFIGVREECKKVRRMIEAIK